MPDSDGFQLKQSLNTNIHDCVWINSPKSSLHHPFGSVSCENHVKAVAHSNQRQGL